MNGVNKKMVTIIRFVIVIAFLGLWELCARLNIIDAFIFSSPSRIILCFQTSIRDGILLKHTLVTLGETFLSFGIIIAAGVGIALVLWLSPFLSQLVEPFLIILEPPFFN